MNRRFRLISILSLALTACAPSATTPQNETTAADIARVFALEVDGKTYFAHDAVFTYANDDYELSFQLIESWINFHLVNTSGETIRVLWDESAMVLPDGQSSRVVSDAMAWDTRNNPQAPSVIPSGAALTDAFNPLVNADYDDGIFYYYMFALPIQEPTTIRLLLRLQIGDEVVDKEFRFVAEPNRMASN